MAETTSLSPDGGPDIRAGRRDAADYAAAFADAAPPLHAHAGPDRGRALPTTATTRRASTACPTGIDVPTFIRRIARRQPARRGAHHPRSQPARRHVRPRLPDRGAVRAGLRAQHQRGQAGRDRPAAALRHRRGISPSRERRCSRAPRATGKRVAVVGAGPAGLACAHRPGAARPRRGDVTTREPKAGGLNEYGLATYKTAGDFAQKEIDWLLSIGGIDAAARPAARPATLTLDALARGLRRGLPRRGPGRRQRARRRRAEDLRRRARRDRLHRRAAPGDRPRPRCRSAAASS